MLWPINFDTYPAGLFPTPMLASPVPPGKAKNLKKSHDNFSQRLPLIVNVNWDNVVISNHLKKDHTNWDHELTHV